MTNNNISFFIKNIKLPICIECINFNFSDKSLNGFCTKFGEKNIITGKIKYNTALYNRTRKCGLNANYFEPHNYDK